jgi:hypothetical protein
MEPAMPFQIHALAADQFSNLFDLSDAELAAMDAQRVTADRSPGFPCRVSLADAVVGETLILLNYQHIPQGSPYAASHAIYIRQQAGQAELEVGYVPDVLARRLLSVRGFDKQMIMQDADVVAGHDLDKALFRLFENPNISEVHIHNAKQGCFAAKATRA